MKNYVFVRNSNHKRIGICYFKIDRKALNSLNYVIDEIQDKGELKRIKLPFYEASTIAIEGNSTNRDDCKRAIFNLNTNERVEYVDAKKSSTEYSSNSIEEDEYDVMYYRYNIHPLIEIYNDLKNGQDNAIMYSLKKILMYVTSGTDEENYYATEILSTISFNDKKLNNHTYQLLLKLLFYMKQGLAFRNYADTIAVSSEDFNRAKRLSKVKR